VLLLVSLVSFLIIAIKKTSLGGNYYHAISSSGDQTLAALVYETFVAGAGIFLGTYIFPSFFLENTKYYTRIQDYGIFIRQDNPF